MDTLMPILAQSAGGGSALGSILWLGIIALCVASMWKVFAKAGQPGWAAIVPIYNIFVLCKIVGRPAWWVLLFFIPFVNIVAAVLLGIDTAKVFGKGAGFGIGLALLGFIFFPILAFGSAQYQGPQSGSRSFSLDDHAKAA